jgi:ATP-dependent Lon protease
MPDTAFNEIDVLSDKITKSTIPDDLKSSVQIRLEQLKKLTNSPTFLPEYDRMNKYIDWIVSLPWNNKSKDNLDLINAKKILDVNHFGLEEIKDRILEYISVMKLKQEKNEGEDIYRAPILCFVGLVGTGKTTIAYSIAEALGRKIARIPFGGMGDPLDLRGQSKMHPEAEPGKIIKALRTTQFKNSVILLDEIDRVTDIGRASIMGVLVELLDPGQNHAFSDHYIDYPFDLSECIFIATANNTTSISTAVMDRLEPIMMPSYTDQEKITIGQKYVFPKAMKAAGIPSETLKIDDDVWVSLVRPLGYDAGIRTMERTIEGVVRKVARLIVEGKGTSFTVTLQNIKEFLPL